MNIVMEHPVIVRRPLFRMPLYSALLLLAIYAITLLFFSYFRYLLPPGIEAQRELSQMQNQLLSIIPPALIAIYGIRRVAAYHPQFERRYSHWLRTVPWTAGMPLPLGPVHLVWEDAFPVFIAIYIVIRAGGDPFIPLTAFVVAYLFAMLPLITTGEHIFGYVIGFGMAALYLMWPFHAIIVALLAVMLVTSQAVHSRWMKKFPWHQRIEEQAEQAKRARSTSDWRVGPLQPSEPLPLLDRLLLPLLAGFGLFTFMSREDFLANWNSEIDKDLAILALAVFLLNVFRLGIYIGKYHSPITVWGRLCTARLIIPGYDYVFIAPFLASALTAIVVIGMRLGEVNPPITFGIGAAMALMLTLNLPPSRRRWQLTGHHQIVIHRPVSQS